MRNIIQLSFIIVLVIQVILSMFYGILDALLMGSSGIVLILILLLHIPIILSFFSGGSGGSSIHSPQHAVYYNNTTGKVEHHFYRGNAPPHNQFHRQKIGQGNHTLNYLRRIK